MDPTPWVLAVPGVALAGPVPALLARASWLRHTPTATMLLWQGVALADYRKMLYPPGPTNRPATMRRAPNSS